MADIISTIRNALDRLKRAERRVAECVLREPHRVIRYTITELAEKAETSEPTVVRFCRKIGLEGYMDLKWEEVYNYEHTPHPVEFQMYYSC